MRHLLLSALLGTALLALIAPAAAAEELTVKSISAAQQSGATADGIIAMINSPANTVAMTSDDIITLRNAGVPETVLAAIWARIPAPAAAAPVAAPAELVFDDLVLVTSFLTKHREGRLVLQGDTFTWQDRDDPKQNFTFQVSGLEKVWFTCEARTPDNFCYQINFAIVRGEDYSFRDSHRKSGSNASVTTVMEALRTYFPRLAFGAPDA